MTADRKGAALRATAATIVDAVATSGRSLDAALAEHEAKVDPDGRALLRLLCYGALRRHWRLHDWIAALVDRPLKPRDSVVDALISVGLYQLTETRIPEHAAVSLTVEAARLLRRPKLAGLVNAVLRRFLREGVADREPGSAEARHDHPGWLIESIRRDWPGDADAILEANNERAPMWLRVNSRRTDAETLGSELRAAGIDCEISTSIPGALRLAEPMPVDALPGFEDGRVSVQDAAAQLAAPWLLGGIRGRVLDACAAPGGKSAHLKELGGEDIDLTCVDSDEQRLEAVRDNLGRLDLAATVLHADASNPQDWWDGVPYDGILLDAPCSATGVIRRHPDIKLLRRAADVRRLAGEQRALLDALWPLLAPGGRLLYVTCSVLAAENDAVVGDFLAAEAGVRENDVLHNNNIRDVMRRKAVGFQVLPGSDGLDGFYFACLEGVR